MYGWTFHTQTMPPTVRAQAHIPRWTKLVSDSFEALDVERVVAIGFAFGGLADGGLGSPSLGGTVKKD
jgi:hypothetical protein